MYLENDFQLKWLRFKQHNNNKNKMETNWKALDGKTRIILHFDRLMLHHILNIKNLIYKYIIAYNHSHILDQFYHL